MIRPALETDRAFITSSWLQSFASSPVALDATPKDEAHTVACDACGCLSLRTSGKKGGTTKVHAGQAYWSGQRKLIERLLRLCNVSVLESSDGLIDGWVCREPSGPIEQVRPVVHFWYVRASSRGQGVTRTLLADIWHGDVPVLYTHKPRGLDCSKLPRGWCYSDYWLKGAE